MNTCRNWGCASFRIELKHHSISEFELNLNYLNFFYAINCCSSINFNKQVQSPVGVADSIEIKKKKHAFFTLILCLIMLKMFPHWNERIFFSVDHCQKGKLDPMWINAVKQQNIKLPRWRILVL